MNYKAKRNMIIIAVILVLAIIATVGTVLFISGNDETQAVSQTNGTSTDRAGQEIEQAQTDNSQTEQNEGSQTSEENENNENTETDQENTEDENNSNQADEENENNENNVSEPADDNNNVTDNNDNDSTSNNNNTNMPETTVQTITTEEQNERIVTMYGFTSASLNYDTLDISATIPDVTAPTVDIKAEIITEEAREEVKDLTNAQSIIYTFTWSELVEGFSIEDLDFEGFDKENVGELVEIEQGRIYEFTVFTEKNTEVEGIMTVKAESVTDLAGNKNAEDTEKTFLIDTKAPKYNNMGIFNWTNNKEHENESIDEKKDYLRVATNNEHIRLFISFPEMLANNPKVDIYGEDGTVTTLDLEYSEGAEFYYVEFDTTEEFKLPEGKIKYKVYGYSDVAGNIGADLSEEDTLSKEYPYVVMDRIAPVTGNSASGFPLYILNVSANNEEDIEKYPTHYQYIQNDKILKIEANFTEKLDSNITPIVTIGTGQNTLSADLIYREKLGDKYRYTAEIEIDNDKLKLEEGQRIEFTINNVADYAGNTAEFNNEDVTQYYKNDVLLYDQVFFDEKAPEYYSLEILNNSRYGEYKENKDITVLQYATYGNNLKLLISFKEKLAVPPTLEIGGKTFTMNYSDETSKSRGREYYDRTIKIGDGENEISLEEGLVEFKVYGYEDAAGNTVSEENALTEQDVQNTEYIKVIYDVTPPTRTSADFYVVGKHDETLVVEVSDNKKEQYQFAKNGDTIVMNAQFKEKLANIPTFVLIDSARNEINLNKKGKVLDRGLDENTHCYLYQASYTIAENEAIIAEGLMTIEISKIYDLAGLGEGYVITKPSNSRMIYYDRTDPELRVKNDEEDGKDNNGNSYTIGTEPNYSKIAFKLHDNIALKEIVINGEVRTISDSDKIVTLSDANFEGFMSEYVKQGENTVILRDWAGNETEPYTFNYDTTAPARVYSTVRLDKEKEENPEIGEDENKYYHVKNGEEFEFAMAFTEELKQAPTVTIAGRNVEMTLNEKVKEEESKYLYEGTFTIPADEAELAQGILEIKVSNIVDFAGNIMEDTIQTPTINGRIVVYDRTAPTTGEKAFPLYILARRDDNDTRPYTLVRDGEEILIEANFDEELVKNPSVYLYKKDENKTEAYELKYSEKINEKYVYRAYITINNSDFQLEEKDRIDFVIEGVEDKAGNTKTFNNDNVTEITLDDGKNYGQVYYDNTAPKHTSLGYLNNTHHTANIENNNEAEDIKYATIGDSIRVLVSFKEKLGTEPKLRVGDKVIPRGLPFSQDTTDTSGGDYYYLADVELSDDMNLVDGEIIPIVVYGYSDKAGNVGKTLTNVPEEGKTSDIKNTPYTEVTYDISREGKVLENNSYATLQFTPIVDDTSFSHATIVRPGKAEAENYEFNLVSEDDKTTWKGQEELSANGTYTLTVYDKVGYSTPVTFTIDTVDPTVNKVHIYNKENGSQYIKAGDTIRVDVTFSEELGTAPTLTIGNQEVTLERYVNEEKNEVYYQADLTLRDDNNLDQGVIHLQ